MNNAQKIVGAGALTGVMLMIIGVFALSHVLPTANIADTLADRLAYALGANVFALLPFFVMLVTIGNARFLSDAIDPTRHAESPSMEVDGRVAENTLQQNFVFFVASLALSTVLPIEHLNVLWALTLVYVTARIVFWVGYRLGPLFRAPGMSATAYMNLGMIAYTLYMISFLN